MSTPTPGTDTSAPLSSCLSVRDDDRDRPYPPPNFLSAFPVELLLRIISFLDDRADVASFLLSSRHVYTRATEKDFWVHFQKCPTNPPTRYLPVLSATATRPSAVIDSRNVFLLRLCRDLKSSHMFCNACDLLHPYPRFSDDHAERFYFIDEPGMTEEKETKCPALIEQVGPVWWGRWKLSFIDVYLAMLGQKYVGEAGRPLSSLSFSSSWTYRPLKHQPPRPASRKSVYTYEHAPYHYVKLDMAASVLPDNHLVLHTTQRLWIPLPMPPARIFRFQLSSYDGENLNSGFQICKHPISRLKGGKENQTDGIELTIVIFHQLGFLQAKRENKDAVLDPVYDKEWRCGHCSTAAKLTTHDHGSRGVEMVLDTWQELGSCSAPDNIGWAQSWREEPESGAQRQGQGQGQDNNKTFKEYRAGEERVLSHIHVVKRPDEMPATGEGRPEMLSVLGKSALEDESAPAVMNHFKKTRARRRWSKLGRRLSLLRLGGNAGRSWRVRGSHPAWLSKSMMPSPYLYVSPYVRTWKAS